MMKAALQEGHDQVLLNSNATIATSEPLLDPLWTSAALGNPPEHDAKAVPTRANKLAGAWIRAVRNDGRFIPPLVLIEGRLRLVLDDVAYLEAIISSLASWGGDCAELKAALAIAEEVLAESPMSAVIAKVLLERLLSLYDRQTTRLPHIDIRQQVERMLTRERRFRQCRLLGAEHVQTELAPYGVIAGDGQPKGVAVYMPIDAAARLPAIQNLNVRLWGTLHQPLEQGSDNPYALRLLKAQRIVDLRELLAERR